MSRKSTASRPRVLFVVDSYHGVADMTVEFFDAKKARRYAAKQRANGCYAAVSTREVSPSYKPCRYW